MIGICLAAGVVTSWNEATAEVYSSKGVRALPWKASGNSDRFRLAPMPAPPDLAWSSIPAGTFQMGSTDGDDDERPVHAVHVDAFEINTTEVTNAEYRHRDPDHQGDDALPVANVTWFEADAYCRWLGAADTTWSYRLPTEAEWEYAARGTDGQTYPWGNEAADQTRAMFGGVAAAAVGTHPAGQGPFGTQDQVGNVSEWVRDWYGPYDSTLVNNPTGPDLGEYRVLRGASWHDYSVVLRSADRNWGDPSYSSVYVGFRCVRVPRPEP